MSKQEPTNKEIMETVAGVKENTEQILEAIGVFSNRVESRFDKLEGRVGKIEANMVTKDLLDEKLNDLKADLTILMRKEDHKVVALIDLLKQKRIISEAESLKLLSMEPFPKS